MKICKNCNARDSEIIFSVQDGDEITEHSYCTVCKDTDCFKEIDDDLWQEELEDIEGDAQLEESKIRDE